MFSFYRTISSLETVTKIELRIANSTETQTLTAEGANYDAAKSAVDAQVPDGWQKLVYRVR